MHINKELAATLFKAEHFPNVESGLDVLEWSVYEVEKVAGSMTALSVALCTAGRGVSANIRDVDIEAFLSLLEGRLRAVIGALGVAIDMKLEQQKEGQVTEYGE